jgi:hypothetical protein
LAHRLVLADSLVGTGRMVFSRTTVSVDRTENSVDFKTQNYTSDDIQETKYELDKLLNLKRSLKWHIITLQSVQQFPYRYYFIIYPCASLELTKTYG